LKPKTQTKTKQCKPGTTRRRAYTRTNGIRVSAACIPRARPKTHRAALRCPPGQIARTSYVRRLTSRVKREGYMKHTPSGRTITVHPKKKTIAVPAGCIKNVGQPGHGPASSGLGRQGSQIIGPLRKGQLSKYGYSYKLPEMNRRAALARAIAVDGRSTVYHRLNAVAKLAVSRAPQASAVFAADRNWVRLQKH
jgi:Family of unknown function (DUF5771)